jgi:hypothetical protein
MIQAARGTLGKLIGTLRETCACLPDKRTGRNVGYTMADIGMAAFSVFFMQSPSFLAHQRRLQEGAGHGRSNCQTLLEMSGIPCDNRIRAMLDPVEPQHFFPVFDAAFATLEECGGLSAFQHRDGRLLIVLDGTEHFRSDETSRAHCSRRSRAGGKIEYFHTFSPPLLWLRITTVCSRHRRNLSPRTMAVRNRIARVVPRGAGSRLTVPVTPASIRSISVTICSPANRCARLSARSTGISSLSASHPRIR